MKKALSSVMMAVMLMCIFMISPAAAADKPVFSVTDAEGKAGEEVVVCVDVSSNPGVIAFGLQIGYDATVLELKEAVIKDFEEVSFGPVESNPFNVTWEDALNPDNTKNGIVAQLTFEINKDAAVGKYDVTITYDADNVFNSSYQNVEFDTKKGTVDVIPAKIDVTGVTVDKELSVDEGQKKTLSYTVSPADASDMAVSFSSDNPSVASVDELTGEVTGNSKGTANITVTTKDGGVKDTCVVTVNCVHKPDNAVKENVVPASCNKEGSYDEVVYCKKCKEKLNTVHKTVAKLPLPKVVTLGKTSYIYNGKKCEPAVKSVKDAVGKDVNPLNYSVKYSNNINAGTATVTVTFKSSYYTGKLTKTFTIKKASNKITSTASYTKTAMGRNQSFTINAKAIGGNLTYKSNDKNVKVDKKGKVTIAKNYSGQATITITAGNNNYTTVSKTVKVTVVPAVTTLKSVKNSTAKNAKKGSFTVIWNKLSYVTGYQLQYSTNSSFKTGNKSITIKGAANVKNVVSGLVKGKNYYVRIRTYKTIAGKNVFGNWSVKKSVKI